MNVLHPAYSAKAIRDVVAATPKGQESRVWIIANPNSGPGIAKDKSHDEAIRLATSKGFKIVYYVDLMAGKGYSPANGKDNFGPRAKTANEVVFDMDYYRDFYGTPDAWFFDDCSNRTVDAIPDKGKTPYIINPGCQFAPPRRLDSVYSVIHESEKNWPRNLSPWEKAHKAQCAVMGLKVQDVRTFKASCSGLGFIFASPLGDDWQAGQTAYDKVTPYLREILA